MRRFALAGMMVIGVPVAAHARDPKEDRRYCAVAANRGQELRDAHQLAEAREEFIRCSSSECPSMISRDCASWLTDVDARLPTVVFRARDSLGVDLVKASVWMDGRPFVTEMNGAAIPVNPGPHRFRFESQGFTPQSSEVVIAEREKGRIIGIDLVRVGAESPVKDPDPVRPLPTANAWPLRPLTIALAGVGVVGLGSFLLFGLSGAADYRDAEASCGHSCPSATTSPIRTKLIVADISVGISLVTLGLATYFFIRDHQQATPKAISWNASATPSGGSIGLTGSF